MARYHVNKNGEPAVCSAQRSCPLGGEGDHIDTTDINEARAFAETKNAEEAGGSTKSIQRNKENDSLAFLNNLEKKFSPENKLGLSAEDIEKAPNTENINEAILQRVNAEKEYRKSFDDYMEVKRTSDQNGPSDTDEILDAQARYQDAETNRYNAISQLTREKNVANGLSPHWTNDPAEIYAEPSRGRYTEEQLWGNHPKTKVGSNTPWGKADTVDSPAHGIVVVQTPGKGGVKLSAKRNKRIPEALRNSSGWYEEGSESQIVGWKHPEAFPDVVKDSGGTQQASRKFEKNVRDQMPDEYNQATGKTVSTEKAEKPSNTESLVEQYQKASDYNKKIREENPDKFVTENENRTKSWVPKGYVLNHATKQETGEERVFLVKESEVEGSPRKNKAFVIDENKHIDVTDIEASAKEKYPEDRWPFKLAEDKPKYGKDLNINTDGLSPTAKQRAYKELNTRYRVQVPGGGTETRTLQEHIEKIGVKGKYTRWDGKNVVHTIDFEDEGKPRSINVHKSVHDSIKGTKDITGPLAIAEINDERSGAALRKALRKYGSDDSLEAKAAIRKADNKNKETTEEYNDMENENRRSWDRDDFHRENLEKQGWDELVRERNLSF